MKFNENSLCTMRNYDILDLLKFVMAILIIATHSSLFPKILYPWLRLAVPIFFTVSSYLFFNKISELSLSEQKNALSRFVKRNLILYAVWFVIQLPITLYLRKWFAHGVLYGIKIFLKNLFFGSTFLASWFIMANVIALLIIFLCRKFNTVILLFVTAILNMACCFVSGYRTIIPAVAYFNELISPILGNIACNFVVALFWIALGKAFSEGLFKLKRTTSAVSLAISCIALLSERILTERLLNIPINRDCYFMLMPCALFLFSFCLGFRDIKLKHSEFLRKSSTLIYVMHYPIILIASNLFAMVGINSATLKFFVALSVTLAAAFVIILLSKFKRLKFLRYLY